MIRPPVDDLLGLAIADPDVALVRAHRIVAAGDDDSALSVAHQAMGIVLRHRGRMDEAVRELRAAVRLARRTGDVDREADTRATLGVTLAMAGRTRVGLAQLDESIATAVDPLTLGKAAMRRGHVWHYLLAEEQRALADLEPALASFRVAGDRVWEARTLNVIGGCHLALGEVAEAERAIRAAGEIFTREGQALEAVITVHNEGSIAFRQGDLPRALRLFDKAAEGYESVGSTRRSWPSSSATRSSPLGWRTKRSSLPAPGSGEARWQPSTWRSSCWLRRRPSWLRTRRRPRCTARSRLVPSYDGRDARGQRCAPSSRS